MSSPRSSVSAGPVAPFIDREAGLHLEAPGEHTTIPRVLFLAVAMAVAACNGKISTSSPTSEASNDSFSVKAVASDGDTIPRSTDGQFVIMTPEGNSITVTVNYSGAVPQLLTFSDWSVLSKDYPSTSVGANEALYEGVRLWSNEGCNLETTKVDGTDRGIFKMVPPTSDSGKVATWEFPANTIDAGGGYTAPPTSLAIVPEALATGGQDGEACVVTPVP